ncbi:hypothetical protein [Escherichia coli]|uniref:hypothetical protein n=1 Tax=Escherichia coli TaxID=562 RepID=UPI0035CCED98
MSNNPLSQSLYTGRTDEFGQIEFALRMMQAETGAIVGRIGDASNRLSEHTRGLLKDIESSNVLTVEQQAETESNSNGSKPNGGKHSRGCEQCTACCRCGRKSRH